MTAVLARPLLPLLPAGQQVPAANLWFPGQQDQLGLPIGPHLEHPARSVGADPDRYVAWVLARPGRNRELAPRKALHIGLRPSPGIHDCQGCRFAARERELAASSRRRVRA